MSEHGYNSEGNPTDYQWKLEKQRQFQHNDCSGLLAGYHFDDVNVKVDIMRDEIEQLQLGLLEVNAMTTNKAVRNVVHRILGDVDIYVLAENKTN